MLVSFQGPQWLFGIDIGIQLIGAILALLIALYGYKCYKMTSSKIELIFSLAFLLLGASFLIYVLLVPAIYIYYNFYQSLDPGIFLKGSHILNFIFLLSTLGAYAILNLVYSRVKNINAVVTVFILIFALAYFIYYSRNSLVLSIINIALLLLIVFNTLRNWIKTKNTNALLVVIAFVLITLANVFFALGNYINISFLFGHVSQLLGYISLLVMVVRINHGGHRKKK